MHHTNNVILFPFLITSGLSLQHKKILSGLVPDMTNIGIFDVIIRDLCMIFVSVSYNIVSNRILSYIFTIFLYRRKVGFEKSIIIFSNDSQRLRNDLKQSVLNLKR